MLVYLLTVWWMFQFFKIRDRVFCCYELQSKACSVSNNDTCYSKWRCTGLGGWSRLTEFFQASWFSTVVFLCNGQAVIHVQQAVSVIGVNNRISCSWVRLNFLSCCRKYPTSSAKSMLPSYLRCSFWSLMRGVFRDPASGCRDCATKDIVYPHHILCHKAKNAKTTYKIQSWTFI